MTAAADLTPSQRDALVIALAREPSEVWCTNKNRPPAFVARGTAVALHGLGLFAIAPGSLSTQPNHAGGFVLTDTGRKLAHGIRREWDEAS